MTRPSRLTMILGALNLLAIVVAGGAINFQLRERALRLVRERELARVRSEKQELEQQLSEVRKAKQQVEADLSHSREQLTQLNQQLAKESQAKEALAKSMDDRQHEIDRLMKDLEQARAEKTGLTDQVAKLQKEQQSFNEQLTQLQQAKTELETKLAQFSEHPTVELEKVVVTKPSAAGQTARIPSTPATPDASAPVALSVAAPASPGLLQGQVVVVNRQYDFIVMDIGRNKGLEMGQEFQVSRGDQVLGRVKVEKIYDELSAASILPNSKKDAIKEGDLVKAI